jgi:hypothetical protein
LGKIFLFLVDEGYSLSKLLKAFDVDGDVNHDALDDAYNLLNLVRAAKPKKKPYKWYSNFLMSSYKLTSKLL